MGFDAYSAACPHQLRLALERRPGNALNIEIGQPMPRCRLRAPRHWSGFDPRGTRWLLSGGNGLVFGICSASSCPLRPNHCKCGHRMENHISEKHGCCAVENCTCDGNRP